MIMFIWVLVAIFFHIITVENNPSHQIKYTNINVDINKPIGYSIHRFRCFFTSCNYEFDPNDLSYTIWQIVDDEVVVIQNLHHIYKNYGRNHLIPVLQSSRKNFVNSVIEVLNVTLSKPMDSCSPFFLPKLIDSGWIMAKSPVGSVVLGLEHLIFKSGKECTPQIWFTDKTISNNYNFTISSTADPKLFRIHIYTRKYVRSANCNEQYSCREYISLILTHKPTGTYQTLNVTINILASGLSMPYVTSHFVNHIIVPLDTPVGELVGQVNVNDYDPGFDGELVYTITISPYFFIDTFSGKVYLLQTINTPVKGHLEVTVRDRSCYIHSQILLVKLFYSTVSNVSIYKRSALIDYNNTDSRQPLYKVVDLYDDLPIDSYVVSGAEFAHLIKHSNTFKVKFSFSDQHSKQLLYVKDGAMYYRGISEQNSGYLSPSIVHHIVVQINVDASLVYTAQIYIMFHPGRICLGALPKIIFNQSFQIVNTGNFDTRINFDPTIEFHYNEPGFLVDYRKAIVTHNPCFSKKHISYSVVDSHGSDIFYMSENSNYISSKYPLYDPDNDYYILIQAVNKMCDSEISYKGFAIVKLNVQLKHNKYIPFFHNSTYVFNISESLKPPSYVGSVKIRFADSIGYLLNSNYFYYIKNYNTITSSYIALDRNSGVITLLKNVDRELLHQLKFGISAFNPQNNHSVETVVIINIDDEDDNPPVFPKKHIEINLEHNSGYIEQVLCVHADDKDDTRKFPLSYYIHKGPKHLFHLHPSTGVLSLVSSLKTYISNDTIKLHIRARDTHNFDEMVLNILVEKSIDEAPLFAKFVHNITLVKDALAGTLVAIFDVEVIVGRLHHLCCRFGRDISFTFASLFSVRFDKENKACFLYLVRSLVYNDVKNILSKQNSFLLELYDSKQSVIFPAQSLVNVKLLLTDNRVVFEQNNYIFQHFELLKKGDHVGQVNAFNFYQNTDHITYKLESFLDCDSSKNCSDENLHSLFSVDAKTGVIIHIQSLLAVGFEEEVIISATNSAGLQTTVSCKIIVLPLAYKPLFVSIKPIEISLSEGSPIGTGYTIASYKASGQDQNHVSAMVDIVGGNWLNHFKIVNNETITLIHKIDYECIQSYTIRYRWKHIVDNNTFDSVYLENVVRIKVIDENDNVPIFPNEDATFLIIQGLSYSRQYFAHFQAYDGDTEHKFRKINYKFVNSKVSVFIHHTLGIVSVTNDFTLFDQVMVLTIRAENEDNPSLHALKNFSIIIVQSEMDDNSLDPSLSDQYKAEMGNMNIEFNLNASPIQYIPRKNYNHKPQYTIGRLFQNPLYGQHSFICADPYGFNNIYSIDTVKKSFNLLNNHLRFTSADSMYVYKVSRSVYRIQNIVIEVKSLKPPSLECNNFNDDFYFLSNNNISKINPKLSCDNFNQENLQYSLVSTSRRDFNDVLTLGTHSGVVYIHKLPDLLFPITEYFTYQIMDPATNNYVFGRLSIQIVNINYDIKISDLPIITVFVDSPLKQNQFIYNPRLSDGRTSVGYKFYWILEPLENSNLPPWLTINSTNGHITTTTNFTLSQSIKLSLRATLLSPNGDNVTSATQLIQLIPHTLFMNPMTDTDLQLSYVVSIQDEFKNVLTPYGLYVGRIPILSKGIQKYHCEAIETNLISLPYQRICENILILNHTLYLTPTIYTPIEHFKRFLNVKMMVCRRKCVPLSLNILIIRPTSSAPYFVDCMKNQSIFVENNQPISIPLNNEFVVPRIFEDVFVCSVYSEMHYLSAQPKGGSHCAVAPSRYLKLDSATNFTEKLSVDFKPHYLKYYADKILLRNACSNIDLSIHNYFPYYDPDIDNYGVASVDDGIYLSSPITCIQKQSYGSVFKIVYSTHHQYLTVDINDGCIYMLKPFNYTLIHKLTLIVEEVLFKLSDSPSSKICQKSCIVHHRLIVVVKKLNKTPEIIVQTQNLNIPTNAPLNYKILDLSENPREAYFFISYDNFTNKADTIQPPPIDIDPSSRSLVTIGNISQYINYAKNIPQFITLNMVHKSAFNSYTSLKKLYLYFNYVPAHSTKPSFTFVVPFNHLPGIIGKVDIKTLNLEHLSYSLKTKTAFKFSNEVFKVNSAGEIYLLKRLDPLWFEFSLPEVIDLEILVIDNAEKSQSNISLPVCILLTHLWSDYSLSYTERDLTITYDELAQFGTGSQIRNFNINDALILLQNTSSNLYDSHLFTGVLVPLITRDKYRPMVSLSPNGTLYKTVDNVLLRGKKLNDQVYALDLRNSKGDIMDSTILQLVELSEGSQLKCVYFNSSPIVVSLHPNFKINKLIKTIHFINKCNNQKIHLVGYFNELAECVAFGTGKQSYNLYLICELKTLLELLHSRTTMAYFIFAIGNKSPRKVYNRLILDFRRLYCSKYSDHKTPCGITFEPDVLSHQPYSFKKKREVVTVSDNILKGEVVTYIEPMDSGNEENLVFMLKCSIAHCPFSINATTGAIYSKYDQLTLNQKQYNVSVVLVDQYHHYVFKSYDLVIKVENRNSHKCNKNLLNSISIQIGSKLNKPGTPITQLPLTFDSCFLVADLMVESSLYFFLNPITRIVYISKKLPYKEEKYNFAYFLSPTLVFSKRDPSFRFLLTVELLKDDFSQIRFLCDKREFTISKLHPVVPLHVLQNNIFKLNENYEYLKNAIIGFVYLDSSKVDTLVDHKLAVRITGGEEINFFSAHLHPNMTSVAIFQHRKFPIQHCISKWNLTLELYQTDNMFVVDKTTPYMISVNVLNLATTSPLLNFSIGKINADDSFPQTAGTIQFFSPDSLDLKFITVRVDPALKSFIRIVRSADHLGQADVVIQSLWKAASNKKFINFDVEIGYRQLNDSTSEKLLFTQQYTLYVIVLNQNTLEPQSNMSQLVPRSLSFKTISTRSESINLFFYIPALSDSSSKEMPVFIYRGEASMFPSSYYFSNFTLLGANYINRLQRYFIDDVEKSRLFISTNTPSGNYRLSAQKIYKKSKKFEHVPFNVKVFKRNETIYQIENYVLMVLRSNKAGVLYTSSSIFFNIKNFISITKSKCFGASSQINIFILSLEHNLYFGRQLVHLYVGAVDERSNLSMKSSVLLEKLQICQQHIEHQLQATIVSFDDNTCVAHSCELGTCVSTTTINYDNSVVVAYVFSDHSNSEDYHIFPKLNQTAECSSERKANRNARLLNICMNGGFKASFQNQPSTGYNFSDTFVCACPSGFSGKYCESTEVSFSNKSQQPLIFDPIIFDVNTDISFSFVTSMADAVILLQNSSYSDILKHFHFAVKLLNGSLVVELLFYNANSTNLPLTYENIMSTNMTSIVVGSTLNDGQLHRVSIIKRNKNIMVKLDNCEHNIHTEQPFQKTSYNYSMCGVSAILLSDQNVHSGLLKLRLGSKFSGCIRNFKVNSIVMDFNSFLPPQPPHTTLNMCLFGLKNCPRCKNGYCDRSTKPPYNCHCYDGWTGSNCNIRMNSFSIKYGGYIMVDQSLINNTTAPHETESSDYSFYVEFSPVFSFLPINGQPPPDHIFIYESNDDFTEYSLVRVRNGYIEFVNNLGDGECLVQFPFDFKNYNIQTRDVHLKNFKHTLKSVIYKIEYLKSHTKTLPLKKGFLKIVAKRNRNMITLNIPNFGKVSSRCGINNLLDSNYKISIGNAPIGSPHHLEYGVPSSLSTCYASISLNGMDVNNAIINISKYNASVDCPCKQNDLICVGKSVCVGSHEDYCGCLGYPGTYCGHLQLTFSGRNLLYMLVLFAIFVSLWTWLCLLIYKNFRFRYYRFKRKKIPKQSSQTTSINTCGVIEPQENNLSSSYPPSLQQFNDINVKNIVNELKCMTDEKIHFENSDIHENYKPTFRIFVKPSDDDEETYDQFRTLPPIANDSVDHSTSKKTKPPFMDEKYRNYKT